MSDEREADAGIMLSLTRKTEYALIALTHLVRREGKPASARDIAQKYHLPVALLMNTLNELTHHELVRSTRGARGGYRLARSPETITLAEVIDATEGPLKLTACTGHEGHVAAEEDCDLHDVCPLQGPVQWVHSRLEQFLGDVTLAHLASGATLIGLNVSVGGREQNAAPGATERTANEGNVSGKPAEVVAG